MITISSILSVVLVCIVLWILYMIVTALSAKLGLDGVWVRILWLVVLLIVVIWSFSLFGIYQPIIR